MTIEEYFQEARKGIAQTVGFIGFCVVSYIVSVRYPHLLSRFVLVSTGLCVYLVLKALRQREDNVWTSFGNGIVLAGVYLQILFAFGVLSLPLLPHVYALWYIGGFGVMFGLGLVAQLLIFRLNKQPSIKSPFHIAFLMETCYFLVPKLSFPNSFPLVSFLVVTLFFWGQCFQYMITKSYMRRGRILFCTVCGNVRSSEIEYCRCEYSKFPFDD